MTVSLTEQAKRWIAARLHPGDGAIDATVGNGHDTLFLASRVGENGRVFAFDIQTEAIDGARRRLRQAGLERRVFWYLKGHQHLAESIPITWRSRLRAAMFNLGYLPGGDKLRITRSATTIPALAQAVELVSTGGRITVIAYTGHPGGEEEADSVQSWLGRQPSDLIFWRRVIPVGRRQPPLLFLIEKR